MPIKFGTRDEPDYEVYLHRIGRAGRFGRKGKFGSIYWFLIELYYMFSSTSFALNKSVSQEVTRYGDPHCGSGGSRHYLWGWVAPQVLQKHV
jgi:hypothetical protein